MTAITNAALLRVAGEGKVVVLELPDYATALPGLRSGAVRAQERRGRREETGGNRPGGV